MTRMRKLLVAVSAVLALAIATPVMAQSSPNLVTGQIPSAAQWNSYFAGKADNIPFVGDAGAGGKSGIVPAPPAGSAAAGKYLSAGGIFSIPAGSAPVIPNASLLGGSGGAYAPVGIGSGLSLSGGTLSLSAGGGTGLFAGTMSATPSKAGTGFTSTPINGTATDISGVGILTIPATSAGVMTCQAAPATPYKVVMLLARTGASAQSQVGWSDGTKYELGWINSDLDSASAGHFLLFGYTAFNTPDGGDIQNQGWGMIPQLVWMTISDDGTSVQWQLSSTGATSDFINAYSVAKSSGYLGSSGYTNICFGTFSGGNVTLLSYAVH